MSEDQLPPLASLRAFEAAARLGSIKAAASELAVTPGAVSQQIKALEQNLGVTLFERKNRAISLTEAGEELHPKVSAAFVQIRAVVNNVRPSRAPHLRIHASASIISKWLLVRLHGFKEANPDVKVSIETQPPDTVSGIEGSDVLILCAEDPPEDMHASLIHKELILPVASPTWLEAHHVTEPNDIARVQLLHDTSLTLFGKPSSLEQWSRAAGVSHLVDLSTVISFKASAGGQIVDASAAGTGLAIGRSLLVFSALQDGRLACPFGPSVETGLNYFVCCRKGFETLDYVVAFKDWAFKEAQMLSTLCALEGA